MDMYARMRQVFDGRATDAQLRLLRHEMIHQLDNVRGYVGLLTLIDVAEEHAAQEVQEISQKLINISLDMKQILDALKDSQP